jgi:hypothetical protein
MNRIYKSLIVCLSFMIILSCSEEQQPQPLEYYKIITGKTKKTWKMSTIQWTGEGKDDINYSLNSCLRDDLYVFYANTERLYEVTNGASKCASDEPDTIISDEWSFVNATATLTIIFPLLSDNSLPFYVEKVTAKEMVLQIYVDDESKYSYKITLQSVSEE